MELTNNAKKGSIGTTANHSVILGKNAVVLVKPESLLELFLMGTPALKKQTVALSFVTEILIDSQTLRGDIDKRSELLLCSELDQKQSALL